MSLILFCCLVLLFAFCFLLFVRVRGAQDANAGALGSALTAAAAGQEFFSSVRSRELNKSLRAKKYLIWIQSISATGMITRSLSFEL